MTQQERDVADNRADNIRLGDVAPLGVGIGVFIVALIVMSGGMFVVLGPVMVIEGVTVVGYFAAAAGWGVWIARMMWGKSHGQPMGAVAMGCAAMLTAAWLCAWAGMLNVYAAWGLLIVGWVGLIGVIGLSKGVNRGARLTMSWAMVPAAATVGLMIGAATIAPGMLWRPSEAGGYDVLEYHLQLPAEWLAEGAMRGLQHNVYSYLPNLVEAGFMHLAVIKGGAAEAALSCQLMSAGFALLATCAIGGVVMRLLDENDAKRRLCAATAGAMSLALPWTVVTGSMAYDEQAVQFFAAAAMGLIVASNQPRQGLSKRWWGLLFGAGLLAGVACMAKLTSAGLVALPVLAAIVVWGDKRWRSAMMFVIGAALPVVLFMVRNAVWTGNPVFPMATGLFGTAHWTAEQAARWQAAHQPDLSMLARIARVWDMVIAHEQFAFVLWLMAGVSVVVMIADNLLRRVGVMLAVMIGAGGVFWITMTHEQSRFALPLIVPACIAVGAGISLVRTRWMRIVMMIVLIGWPGAMSWRLWFMHNKDAVLLTDGVAVMQHRMQPYGLINDQMDGVKVYAEGWAVPLYVIDTKRVTYHTVWDRSELGAMIDKSGVRGALAELSKRGYGYLLIDRGMIRLWMSKGNYGYDQSITGERLGELENAGLPRVYDKGSVVIYQLAASAGRTEGAAGR